MGMPRKRPLEIAHPFKLDGAYCRLIPISRGFYVIVNQEDYEWLMQWRWQAHQSETNMKWYAVRRVRTDDGKLGTIWMHREILGLERGEKTQGDHKDRLNTLNNSRKNLRRASHGDNQHNRGQNHNNTSGYKGVCYDRHTRNTAKKWRAVLNVNGKHQNLGRFETRELAREAVRKAAQHMHGDFACTD